MATMTTMDGVAASIKMGGSPGWRDPQERETGRREVT